MKKIPNANDMIEIATATGTDTITTDVDDVVTMTSGAAVGWEFPLWVIQLPLFC